MVIAFYIGHLHRISYDYVCFLLYFVEIDIKKFTGNLKIHAYIHVRMLSLLRKNIEMHFKKEVFYSDNVILLLLEKHNHITLSHYYSKI